MSSHSLKLSTSESAAEDLAIIARNSPIITQQDDDHWPEQTVSMRYCSTASDLLSYGGTRFQWSGSQVALVHLLGTQNRPLPTRLSKLDGALKSFDVDGYQSISGLLGKTLIYFPPARLVRQVTQLPRSKKPWITSFNARTSIAGRQCEHGLTICPRHSGCGKPLIP
jgi:hypothetical protein